MASLPPLTGYNLGGIDQFWFIAVDQVQSIPDDDENVILQDIQLVGNAKFSVGYATQETLQYTENQNRDAQGNFYEQSLSGFYPKDQEGVANLFEGMAAERFIVIFRDNNGYYKLLGSLANPCKFTATFESGDSANGRNGYSFEFTRTDVAKAPFYQGLFESDQKVIDASPCFVLADFTADQTSIEQLTTVTFTGQPDGALAYYWEIQDGSSYYFKRGKQVTHTFRNTGQMDAILTATDGQQRYGVERKVNFIDVNIGSFTEFIFDIDTTKAGATNSDQFQLPFIDDTTPTRGDYYCSVDWGDGTPLQLITEFDQAETLHTYSRVALIPLR
jgi:hypothetical protein